MVRNDSDSDNDLWKRYDSSEKSKASKKKVVRRKVRKKGRKRRRKKVAGRKVNGVYLSDKLLKLLAEIVCTCKK